MKTYHLRFEQKVPISLEDAWTFFSSPANLAKITPPGMRFDITSDFNGAKKMYPGMIITYKISPIPGYTTNWMTEITHVKEYEYFVDEQRFGPYALWHHEHHFQVIEGGVLMTDILNYAIPFSYLGRLANNLFVGGKVKSIFDYRVKMIEELFGKYSMPKPNLFKAKPAGYLI